MATSCIGSLHPQTAVTGLVKSPETPHPSVSRASFGKHQVSAAPVNTKKDEEASAKPTFLEQAGRAMLSMAAAAAIATSVPSSSVALEPAPALNQAFGDLGVLITGQPNKDARSLLRYALPISNKAIKEVQLPLEEISEDLRLPGEKAFPGIEKHVRKANRILNQNAQNILADIADGKKETGKLLLAELQDRLQEFQVIIESKQRAPVLPKQKQCLALVGEIEEAMVARFPFEIPAEFSGYPVLKGRANVEMVVKSNNPSISEVTLEMVIDGYNAPVTAGNFVDLVQRGFYDGMEIQRADGFVVQTGDPEGPADGFIDPDTGKIRRIPLEIFVEGDKEPVYHDTIEELGRYKDQVRIPFNAFGTLAMAREEFNNDSASSQIFWLLKESELTPSSANILDGRYAVFGYVVENEELLADIIVGDVIKSMKVTQGLENLEIAK